MINPTLTRLDPFSLIDDVLRQVRAPLADDAQRRAGFVPAIDAHREGEDLVLAADLPGLDPDNDVSVELSGGGRTLTVSGERKMRREAEGMREVRYGSFSRTVTLPEAVSQDAISADYDAGVLTVRVAGVYAEEKPHRISITSGAQKAEVTASEQKNTGHEHLEQKDEAASA
ncbi:Hsp20/alpha crystallin family protein [Nesterenkonia flava]|uniref:Hsp20/alpha crystallin family protein n=1 Tax=Nesterenkonia flava TaxID=469799 RepID=A0ABU1FRY6_9MICC|nr:Hsp20/alpha crystallin family protein [Nesterenkonia flava]MDR5711092.1 Hsp20/alpha crystallin family protein [Nesterenkonia flava]